MPAAAAVSITAAPPGSRPYVAVTVLPRGPCTFTRRFVPPRPPTSASTVPSPPSAIGTTRVWASPQARLTPLAISSPAWALDADPLKESVAISTR